MHFWALKLLKSFFSCISNLFEPTFQLQGPESRKCVMNESDGTANWSESIRPFCQPKCLPILDISNGKVTCSMDNLVGSICSFQCLNGSILDGSKNMICQLDNHNLTSSWVNSQGISDYPMCKSTCSELKSPSNGEMTCTLSMDAPVNGDSCQFSCQLGFNLTGSKRRKCNMVDNDMKWDGSPTACEPICEDMVDIDHGNLNCSNGNLIGSQCQYSCLETYRLTHHQLLSNETRPDFNVLCDKIDNQTASWSNTAPSCEPICPTIAGLTTNGNITCSGVNKGNTCLIECDESFIINGADELECVFNPESLNSVSWNDEPGICEPTCLSKELSPSEFVRRPEINCTNSNLIGSQCEFQCYQGFILQGDKEKTCLKSNETNADWSHTDPICEPVCDSIRAIPNGTVSCDFIVDNQFVKINDTCIISCDSGFELQGSSVLTCSTMNNKTVFDPEIPTCLPKCKILNNIKNGYVKCSNENSIGSKQGFRPLNFKLSFTLGSIMW